MSQPPMSFPKNPLAAGARPAGAATDAAASSPASRPALARPLVASPSAQPAGQRAGGLTGPAGGTPPARPAVGAGATTPFGVGRPAAAPGQARAFGAGQSPLGAGRNAAPAAPTRPLGAAGGQGARPGVASAFGAGRATAPQPAARAGAERPSSGLASVRPPAARTPVSPASAFRSAGPAPTSGTPFRKELKITDDEFLHLRDLIYELCGIYIAENRKYLVENRLSNRIKQLNLKSFNEYYKFLRYDANRQDELPHLYEVITTNETSFFRNPPQLEVFSKIVLPEIIERQRKAGNRKLRIWSAGCSSGEEPYTLAIIISNLLKGELSSWDIVINANDLSEAVLAAARKGVYNSYTLRTTPKEFVDAYFTKDGNQFTVKPELKKLIRFGPINLNDKDQVKRVEKSQIVFCRNVIIYFDDAMKRRVINAFYDNLEPNGVLLIGHSESLHNISRAFQLEHHTGTIVYRKAN